ncbi:MAG: RNA polymerase sigma factor [Akkermansiaceae bacterium]|nr:RNA polymerase sigma factor [Akkermansiaceae bacterium]
MAEFEELIDAHYQALYRFAYSLAKNPDAAADLVQQTFCIWAQKGHQLKERNKAKTWLFTTLYREHLAIARRSRRFVDSSADEVEYQLPTHQDDNARTLDGKRAIALLSELDETFRAPLTLFYIQQHSYKEIAEILEVPMGTIMSRISRGKKQLRQKMLTVPSDTINNVIELNPNKAESHG